METQEYVVYPEKRLQAILGEACKKVFQHGKVEFTKLSEHEYEFVASVEADNSIHHVRKRFSVDQMQLYPERIARQMIFNLVDLIMNTAVKPLALAWGGCQGKKTIYLRGQKS